MLDGLEYLRTATLGLPYPGHAGKRVVVIGGGFTSMDCSRTSVRQGAERGHARLPPRHEGHAGGERGPRGDRGRRHRHLPGRPDARHHRRRTARSPASSSSGWRSASPTRPAGAARSRRPAPSSRSRATACCWPSARARSSTWIGPGLRRASRRPSSAGSRPTRSRSRPAGPACSAPATSGSARRPSSRPIAEGRRAAYAVDAYLKGHRPRRRSGPARRSPSRSPSSSRSCRSPSEVKEPRYRLKALDGRGAQPQLHRVRDAVHAARRRSPSRPAASSAPARRSASATCAASGIEYGTTLQTLEPQYHQGAGYRSVTENRFTGINHDYIRDDSPRVHPARAVALHRLRPLRPGLRGGRRRGLLRLHADRLRHARHDAARHEPQRHAVRVVRPLRRDVPDRRAHAQAARPPEVRGRREPLHPVRHLRRCLPVRRAARRRRLRARPHRAATSR